jgi:broad specificity phosphatase PhoE
MSKLRTPEPALTSLAETQIPNGHTPTVIEPTKSKGKKCLILSFIRHAEVRPLPFHILKFLFQLALQCQSNVSGTAGIEDPLTEYGIEQAERLGNNWKDVHIDALHASTLQRAHDTALRIVKHNHDTTLKVTTDDRYKEWNRGYSDCARDFDAETNRDHRPLGGESLDDVSSRARLSLTMLLTKYGKELDDRPKEFLDKNKIDSPNDLPQDLPHIVLVSHKVFLVELYNSMVGWNADYPCEKTWDYGNVDW